MGIKRRVEKTPEPSIPNPVGDDGICKEAVVTNTAVAAAVVESTPVISSAPAVSNDLEVSSTPAVLSMPAASNTPALASTVPSPSTPALSSTPAVWIAPAMGEPGKRLRSKMSLLPRCLSTESLEKSPLADDLMGSPSLARPAARRRSIASPARQGSFGRVELSSEGSEQLLQIVAVEAVAGKTVSAAASSSGSSSGSSASSSSSSSDSSSDESEATPSSSHACYDAKSLYKEGQRIPTPPVSDTARDFFISLLEENPESRLAIAWLVERGVFPQDKHNKLLKKYALHKELLRQAKEKALAAPPSPTRMSKGFPKRQSAAKIVQIRNRPRTTAFKKFKKR